jgi:hypothetical protein
MMHDMKTIKRGLASVMLGGTLMLGFAVAQETKPTKPAPTKRSSVAGRDPFKRYEPPKPVVKKVAGLANVPSLQERISQYKAQKQAAMSARMPAPKPTTALLLSEIQVVGISRTPRGYAAIVEATPIKLSYVIYPGEPFFDGQLVAIEDNGLVFRHETVFSDGRRERNVEKKALRQPTPVNSVPAIPAAAPAAASTSAEAVATAKP